MTVSTSAKRWPVSDRAWAGGKGIYIAAGSMHTHVIVQGEYI